MTPEMKKAIEKGRWIEGTHHERIFNGGFEGVVIVRSVEQFISKYGDTLRIAFEVEETNSTLYPKRSQSYWIRPLRVKGQLHKYDPVALGAVLGWMAACAGYGRDQKEEIDREVRPVAESVLADAVRSPADNSFVGLRVRLRTETIKKSKHTFTLYDFSPWNPPV